MSHLHDELESFKAAADKIDAASKRFNSYPPPHSTSSNVTINAGGVAVYVLLIICAFLAGLNVADQRAQASFETRIGKDISDIKRKQDRDDDYLNAIYQIAPQLKPKEK